MSQLKQLPYGFSKWDITGTNPDLTYTDLRGVDLSGADLIGRYFTGSDLRGANLAGAAAMFADFTGANLEGVKWEDENYDHAILANVTGDGDVIVSYGEGTFRIVFTEEILCIGGRQHTIESWYHFSDERILFEFNGEVWLNGEVGLNGEGARWWRINKERVFARIEAKHGARHY